MPKILLNNPIFRLAWTTDSITPVASCLGCLSFCGGVIGQSRVVELDGPGFHEKVVENIYAAKFHK